MNTDDHRLVLLYENMKTRHRVSKVIILNDSRVLLMQKHGTLKWELPGGHANDKEKMSKAACREVREETGISLDPTQLVKIQSNKERNVKTNWYVYTHPVKHKIRLSEEHVNYKWVKKNKLDQYNLSSNTNHLAILSSYDV